MALIDRDALTIEINNPGVYYLDDDGRYRLSPEDARRIIDDAPAVDAVHERWIDSPNISGCVVCSNCMSDNLSAQVVAPAPPWYKYCPNCGAKMDLEE